MTSVERPKTIYLPPRPDRRGYYLAVSEILALLAGSGLLWTPAGHRLDSYLIPILAFGCLPGLLVFQLFGPTRYRARTQRSSSEQRTVISTASGHFTSFLDGTELPYSAIEVSDEDAGQGKPSGRVLCQRYSLAAEWRQRVMFVHYSATIVLLWQLPVALYQVEACLLLPAAVFAQIVCWGVLMTTGPWAVLLFEPSGSWFDKTASAYAKSPIREPIVRAEPSPWLSLKLTLANGTVQEVTFSEGDLSRAEQLRVLLDMFRKCGIPTEPEGLPIAPPYR